MSASSDLVARSKKRFGEVWIEKHPELAWAPGNVVAVNAQGEYDVVSEDGKKFSIPQNNVVSVHKSCLEGPWEKRAARRAKIMQN